MTTDAQSTNDMQGVKAGLFGRYQNSEDARSRLAMKAAHKALDIPNDDVQINTSTSSGLGWKEMAVVTAAIVGTAVGTALLTRPTGQTSVNPTTVVQPAQIPQPPVANPPSKPIKVKIE